MKERSRATTANVNRGRRCVQRETWRFAMLDSEHTSVPPPFTLCPLFAGFTSRQDHSRLLGGFAGGFGPKGCITPAFPQVSEVDITRHPPKTAQKPRPMAKSAPISYETIQKSQGADAGEAAAAISAPAQTQSAALRARRRGKLTPRRHHRRLGPTPPSRSLRCCVLHPFAEVLEGRRQHRSVAEARNGHDKRFEQIGKERVLTVDAANAPDDAAVFPTHPA